MTSIREQLQRSIAGAYVIDREVGRGGMATVFLAHDAKHHRSVALKVLDPELGAVLGAERFLSEIRVTAALQHPNLLPLFDSGEAEGLLFYVMPFIEGESLRHRLAREKQLPIDEALRIATAIANALDYAHAHGVIHRDLKPENILLQHGQPIVADFGIALAVSNAGGARVTQTGLSLGTPQYMSPEQATGDRVIDGRTDVYSLAAVTYEMLTGEPPHSGATAQAIIAKLLTTAPEPVRTLRPSVPSHVAAAVEQALAKLPADRFATAKAFGDALANPTFAPASTSFAPSASRAPRRGVERVLAGACVVLLGAALWGWLRPSTAKPVLHYSMQLDSAEAMIPTGRYGRIALSPDGSKLVYVGGPNNALMLRRRDELHAHQIPGTDQAGGPTFSPDGARIAFITNASTLKIVGLDGAPPVVVADSGFGLSGLSWSDDDVIYVDGPGVSPLRRVAARVGAISKPFTSLDTASGEIDQVYPEALPDKRGVLFTAMFSTPSGVQRYAIAIADAEGGAHRIVVENATRARYVPGYLVYSATNGALFAAPFDVRAGRTTGDAVQLGDGVSSTLTFIDLAVSSNGSVAYVNGPPQRAQNREIVWVARDGRVARVDSTWQGGFANPAVSPDGSRIAVASNAATERDSDIWVRAVSGGSPVRLTVEGGVNRFPSWTADGKSIVYASTSNRGSAILMKPADGNGLPLTLARSAEGLAGPVLSRDGKWLVATQGTGAATHLVVVEIGRDSVPRRLFAGAANTRTHSLSPDGRMLAFASNEGGASNSIYVVPFPNAGAAKWVVSRGIGNDPVWSRSGTELFYRDGERNLVAVPVSTSPTFTMGMPTRLFSVVVYANGFDVAPDASRFLFSRPAGGTGMERVTLIENWTALMQRKR